LLCFYGKSSECGTGENLTFYSHFFIFSLIPGGQGPHLFLAAGLRGEVSFVSVATSRDVTELLREPDEKASESSTPETGAKTRLLKHRSSAVSFDFKKAMKIPARRLSTAKITTLERKLIVRRLSDDYIEITSGSCGGSGYEEIQSRSACKSALASCSSCSKSGSSLESDDSKSSYPPGCYILTSTSYAGNYFNSASSSTSCTSTRRCVCKKPAASPTSCVAGKDDKMCQNGGTATGDVCSKPCGCNCRVNV
jgi:hypothetical protein